MSDPFRTDRNRLPEPHADFAGGRNSDGFGKKAFRAIAKLWQIRGTTAEEPAATVSRYALRLIDRLTGKAYSADELPVSAAQQAAINLKADKAGSFETWVIEGDSWSANGVAGEETWPQYISKLIGPRVNIVNAATTAETAATMVGQFSTQCAPYLTAASGKPSTFFLFAGINDKSAGNEALLATNLRTLWAAARAAGARVVAFTLPYRSAGGGWTEAERQTINADIRAAGALSVPLYDVLIEMDIFQTRTNSEMPGGLHLITGAQAKLAQRIMGVLTGQRMTPSLWPDMVFTEIAATTLAGSTRKDLTFAPGTRSYDNNGDMLTVTIGGNSNVTAFIAPVTGTYEITGSVMSSSALVSGNQFYLDAAFKPSGGSEDQIPLDYQIGAGAICTVGRSIRRRLTAGTQVSLLAYSTGTPVLAPNRANFGVRLVSIP